MSCLVIYHNFIIKLVYDPDIIKLLCTRFLRYFWNIGKDVLNIFIRSLTLIGDTALFRLSQIGDATFSVQYPDSFQIFSHTH